MNSEIRLPQTVVGPVEINRLLRELDGLEDFFIAAEARQGGTAVTPPRVTYQLQQLATENKVNLLDGIMRAELKKDLVTLLKTAPKLHISFASEPTPRITDAVVGWLRNNIHPQALLTVGLQPSVAAGCVLRTPNKIFDMSLRQYLEEQESYLVKLVEGAGIESR